jgi:hypothetical protein
MLMRSGCGVKPVQAATVNIGPIQARLLRVPKRRLAQLIGRYGQELVHDNVWRCMGVACTRNFVTSIVPRLLYALLACFLVCGRPVFD